MAKYYVDSLDDCLEYVEEYDEDTENFRTVTEPEGFYLFEF